MMIKISPQIRLTSGSLRGFLNQAVGLQKVKPTLPVQRLCSRHVKTAIDESSTELCSFPWDARLMLMCICSLVLIAFLVITPKPPNGYRDMKALQWALANRSCVSKFTHEYKIRCLPCDHLPINLPRKTTISAIRFADNVCNDCIAFQVFVMSSNVWASYQMRKFASCACTGNAGNISPPPTSKESVS